jgi:predicted ATPase/DNA-binding SARP family transcriptional activator
VRYGLLGALEVQATDGRLVEIAAPKRRALLAGLLLEANRPVSAERLIEVLWDAEPPPAATASLHAHLSRLRRDLGPDAIVSTPTGYRLDVAIGDLDVEVFERRLRVARAAIRDERPALAADELRGALALWRGPALEGLASLPFFQGDAARLEELRWSALEDRIACDLALGRHGEVIAELESLVGRHPLREHIWGQLMVALYRSGRQSEALASYRRLRTILVDELGIDPSPELRALYVQILRQDPAIAGPTPPPPSAGIRLPAASTSLVGRASQLDTASEILRQHRLLTLTGPGGVGKTRLALLVAQSLIADHPDGVLFVDLAAERDPARVLARIGEATGGGEKPEGVIGRRRMLLVLDNFEQVVEAGPQLGALLAQCPNLRLLVTSRTRLRVIGERRLEVPPLNHPEAATLFVDRAEAALAAARLDPALVDDIVVSLDGLPLAVELAAARVDVLSLPNLRARLQDPLALLAGGPRDAPRRHRALRDTIAWSYELLSPASQATLRKLSVFAGGFDLDAGLAVGETTLDGLAELVDQSLVQHRAGRYTTLETIREFAAEEAARHGEMDAAQDRHLAHFTRLADASVWEGPAEATAATNPWEGPAEATAATNPWLRFCGIERDNLRHAFDHAVARDDGDKVVRLFEVIGMYWVFVGAVDEGERWASIAIESARRGRDSRLAWVLLMAAEFPRFSGQLERALALKVEGVGLARAVGDTRKVATGLDDIADIEAALGQFDDARAHLAMALDLRDQEPESDPMDRAHTLGTLAEVALREGRVEEAERWMAEVVAMEAAARPWPSWMVENECLKAKILKAAGRCEEAAEIYGWVVRNAVPAEIRMPLADALDGLADCAVAADPSGAARLIGMSDRIHAEAQTPVWDPRSRARTVSVATGALGPETFERLRIEGHALDLTAMAASVNGVPARSTGD